MELNLSEYKYVFFSKYSKNTVRPLMANMKAAQCDFNNGMFYTNDKEVADALLKNKYYGQDFWLDEKRTLADKRVESLFDEDEDNKLYDRLMEIPRIRAFKAVYKLYDGSDQKSMVRKMKKEEICKTIVANKHRLEPEIEELLGGNNKTSNRNEN